MADTIITRKLMTSKVFSQELIGQTSSNKIHKDVEKVSIKFYQPTSTNGTETTL